MTRAPHTYALDRYPHAVANTVARVLADKKLDPALRRRGADLMEQYSTADDATREWLVRHLTTFAFDAGEAT